MVSYGWELAEEVRDGAGDKQYFDNNRLKASSRNDARAVLISSKQV